MIDIHCHLLPNIDDGPKTCNESIELLRVLKQQGVETVVATPHFYPLDTNLETFLKQRTASFDMLSEEIGNEDLPEILLGAEVYYFTGIGKSKSIKSLCIDKTNYLLLELPMCEYNSYIISDIAGIKENLGITPIIAHIERYAKMPNYRKILGLVDKGICLAQVNTSSVLNKHYERTVKKLIKKGYVSFVASDAHSAEYRPPCFDECLAGIKDKFSLSEYTQIVNNISEFLRNNRVEE